MLTSSDATASGLGRQRWVVVGQVQGVGFRPFVYRVAARLGVTGFIRNDAGGVVIEVQGSGGQLEGFARALREDGPALAVVNQARCEAIPVWQQERGFEIRASDSEAAPSAAVTVDTAVCGSCVTEILDPRDRRHGYGLTNCTDCGPRYSILRRIPYDRPNTTMAPFPMCPACAAEYHEPADRRFHAQPIACPTCGPEVRLVRPDGSMIAGDPIARTVELLAAGKVVAIKGLGGFHLSVRADDEAAVARLRALKSRDHKPFALMCRGLDEARRLVELSEGAEAALKSAAAPIVLGLRRPDAVVAEGVAPGCHRLGVMLPYTPIHHLLFAGAGGQFTTLVMTSGNLSDEPIVIDNADALERLGGMCDAVLLHDRPIERCVDDSVVLDLGRRAPLPVRRSRGYVPGELVLPEAGDSMGLCVGGELKNTVAVVRGGRVVMSQHLGDLNHPIAFGHFRKAVADLRELFGVRPAWIAHDLHPAYLSTGFARQLARELGVPLIGVQHHHAHAAALMAEQSCNRPGRARAMLAVVCDGVGYGPDGTSWGGELLVAELRRFCRLAHLRPLVLPGGDAAARDTRRCGLALLYQALGDRFDEHPAARRLVSDDAERGMLAEMMRKRINCAVSSSAGRVFDGVAALLGVCTHNEYEAQAAMRLEALAAGVRVKAERDESFVLEGGDVRQIDLSPLVKLLLRKQEQGAAAEELAYLFHSHFARAWARTVSAAAETTGLWCVGLSGGVFCNALLTQMIRGRLEKRGIRVLRHKRVPPNDGGIALGQAAVAAAMMQV